MERYSCSTFCLAQGVRRKNLRLELMLGSWVKQRMSIRQPRPSQPYLSCSDSSIILRVIPCNGSLLCLKGSVMAISTGQQHRYAQPTSCDWLLIFSGDSAMTNIFSIEHAIPADFVDKSVGVLLCFGHSATKGGSAQHPPAIGGNMLGIR